MNYHQKCEESATGLWSIEGELQQAKLLGRASRWNAEIYSFDGACSPALMREVCRLRCESYADVAQDAWYAPYVATAKANGLLNGLPTDDGFKPEQPITREEMVTHILSGRKNKYRNYWFKSCTKVPH